MKRFLLAVAFVLACSAPVLAEHGKTQSKAKQTQVAPTSERLRNALGGFNRGDPNDPYWEPCLSYQRGWGTGACGGR
jgi:hypothetical protein